MHDHHPHSHHEAVPPLIEARGVTYQSSVQEKTPLFKDLQLTLKEGETLGILGPSGVGKTILLKLLAGLLEPQSGEVRFRGRDLRAYSKEQMKVFRRQVGMSFQRSGLFDSMSAAENIAFPLRELTGKKDSELTQIIASRLSDVGLEGQGDLRIQEMSGGMQKRLGIARALALEPELVLYDDPTAGLDPVTSRSIIDLLIEMRSRHSMTVILVTSAIGLALRFCDRLAFLYGGKLHLVASRDEFASTKDPIVKQFLTGSLEGPLSELASFS